MPSHEYQNISPLLIFKKGTGHRSGSNSIQKKFQFRTALLHSNYHNPQKHTGEERTPVREGMLHFLSRSAGRPALPASLSVEAAVALPLFIAAMCLLMYPMRIMNAQIEAQICMERAGELVSAAEAVKTSSGGAPASAGSHSEEAAGGAAKTENGAEAAGKKPENTEAETSIGKAMQFAETIGSGAMIFAEFDSDVLGIPIITKLKTPDEKDPCTEIHVTGLVDYPFSGLVGRNFSAVRLVSRRRAWIGREGGAGRQYAEQDSREGDAGEETPDESDTIVYVARNSVNSGRYHTNANCHYISNTMTAVSAETVADLRSSGGGKYHACPSCRPGSSGTVYIFKSGDAFHASKDCKAIQSYAVEITLKEAKERGLTQCTYCSRSH